MPVEGVDDDRRPRRSGGESRCAGERAGLRRVGVEDVRTLLAHDRREPPDRLRVVQRRDLALDLGDVHDGDAQPLGDERHRVLSARERPRDERRVVATGLQPGREVRDVNRRPAHVQASDDTKDADLRLPRPRR